MAMPVARLLAIVFRLVLALVLPLALVALLGAAVRAQQPKLEMHRTGVDSNDGSGWHLAVSTKGSFSIRMPIPFNDFTVRSADPKTGEEVTHAIGARSAEGIKFSAVEIAKGAANLDKVLAEFSAKRDAKVSDVKRATQGGADTLAFSVTGAQTSAHMRYIKTKTATYSLIIEFPNAHRADVAAIKDEFFGSLKTDAR